MFFNRGTDFCEKSVRKGRQCADTLVHDDFFDPVNREENRRRLDSAFFTMRNVVHPVVKRVQVDTTDRHSICCDIQQTSEEPLPRRMQINDNDGIELDIFSASVFLTTETQWNKAKTPYGRVDREQSRRARSAAEPRLQLCRDAVLSNTNLLGSRR